MKKAVRVAVVKAVKMAWHVCMAATTSLCERLCRNDISAMCSHYRYNGLSGSLENTKEKLTSL